jgi:hypothetical protein
MIERTPSAPAPEGASELDRELGEQFYQGSRQIEARYTQEIIDSIKRAIDARFAAGDKPARRDAHAFDSGCVRAIFRVDDELKAELRHGIFDPGREYPAWIRFSNGNTVPKSRWSPDARGMAIKLMGVPGAKLMDDERATQDFILISHPVFFVDDLERYKLTLIDFLKGGIFDQYVRALSRLRGREIWLALIANSKWLTNPLFQQYWSMTPYRLGADGARGIAVKYTAKPRNLKKPALYARVATFLRKDFSLKNEMNRALAGGEMSFDFYIQRHVDQRTPIEDSKVEWTEDVSPLEHVATITLPRQDIMAAEQAAFCENLSFSPWHSLGEHRPLGLVNRVRRQVYRAISDHRHTLNRVNRTEPTGAERFDRR